MAQKREARKIEEQAAEAIRRALPDEFVKEIEGRDPESRKRKRIEGGFGLQGYEAPDEIWYSKARTVGGGGLVDGNREDEEERYLIEDGPIQVEEDAERPQGILSSSTLKALKGYHEGGRGGGMVSRPEPKGPGGPLVAYGSDSDSD